MFTAEFTGYVELEKGDGTEFEVDIECSGTIDKHGNVDKVKIVSIFCPDQNKEFKLKEISVKNLNRLLEIGEEKLYEVYENDQFLITFNDDYNYEPFSDNDGDFKKSSTKESYE